MKENEMLNQTTNMTKAKMLVPFQVKFRLVINFCHFLSHYYRNYTIKYCLCKKKEMLQWLGGKFHGSGDRWRIIRHATNNVLQYQCLWNNITN